MLEEFVNPVLVVDDEPQALRSFALSLRTMGVERVLLEEGPEGAVRELAEQQVGAVLLDLVMPSGSGEALLEHIVAEHPEVPVIIVTGVHDVDTAVRCMRKGAYDYIVKPVRRELLGLTLKRALEFRRLTTVNASLSRTILSDEITHPECFAAMITRCPQMRAAFKYCDAIAQGGEPVLITGETGTGKELLARAVHMASGRPGEFVAVNAAGLDEHAFSDTLFGHVRGAFTGAICARRGLIAQAARGTLFLDEVGALDLASQVRLLRVLQEREYHPLGSDVPQPMQARIVAATNAVPSELLADGRFRKDFYYRLRTHHVQLPPLRERKGDIPLLLDHFVEASARELRKPVPAYPPQLPILLSAHAFPGNIRELRAMVYDAVGVHKKGMLSMELFRRHMTETHVPEAQGTGCPMETTLFASFQPLPTLSRATQDLIREALHRSSGNLRMAAKWLGISHQALSKRLKRADLGSCRTPYGNICPSTAKG